MEWERAQVRKHIKNYVSRGILLPGSPGEILAAFYELILGFNENEHSPKTMLFSSLLVVWRSFLLLFNQQIFVKCLPGTRTVSGHSDTVNKGD